MSDGPVRLLVVEDRMTFRNHLLRTVAAIAPHVRAASMTHGEVLATARPELLGHLDVVLLDAIDLGEQQEDPTRSRLASLDVCEVLAAVATPPRVYAYSTAMARPEVNIPVREQAVVLGGFSHTGVLAALPHLVGGAAVGDVAGGDVAAPDAAAYRALGVDPGAEVAAAHQLMRTRPDAWELVWRRHHRAPEPRTRAWVNAAVRPLLGLSEGNHRRVVGILQRVAGLPCGL